MIKFAIDSFIKENFFTDMKNVYDLKEESKEGKSILHLTVNGNNICVEEYDNNQIHGKCNFLREDNGTGLKKMYWSFYFARKWFKVGFAHDWNENRSGLFHLERYKEEK